MLSEERKANELKNNSNKIKNHEKGQGMTEYIVILALVVISAIGVYSFLGKTLRNQVAGIAKEISGQSAQQELTEAKNAATEAAAKAKQNYGLDNYDESGAF